jgi:hypothetical protein
MAQNIESLDNRPWVPHHIPNPIRRELYRRILDQGLNYVDMDNNWSNYKNYRGPLSAWVRLTSNGTGVSKSSPNLKVYDGFVLYGGEGFHDAFGKLNLADNTSPYQTNILGYDANGKEHILDLDIKNPNIVTLKGSPTRNVPILLPPPGIVSIESNIQKELIRKITINWKCYSFAQLEYMTPYFLTPGISLILEFGWNLFNQQCLLDLTNVDMLKKLLADGTPFYQKTLNSNGMYDATIGTIANFEFGTQDGTTYDCKTEFYSKHRNYTGGFLNESPKTTTFQIKNDKGIIQTESLITKPSLYEFCNQRLKNVTKCLEGEGKNFFEPLTNEERKKLESVTDGIQYDNSELIKKFNNGKKENRIFIARNKVPNDPLLVGSETETYGQPDKDIDWDSSSPDDTWVTMGFVVDLINLFIGQNIELKASSNPNFELFTFNIDDVVIGAHPNLISSDGSTVLIPNPMAPKYNLGASLWRSDYDPSDYAKNKFQSQTSYKTAASFEKAGSKMQLYNKKLYNIFKTGYAIDPNTRSEGLSDNSYLAAAQLFFGIKTGEPVLNSLANTLGAYRNNIDYIINRFRYNFFNDTLEPYDAAFPQIIDYTEKGNDKKAGYWGYLKDLFVNVNVIIEAAKNSKTAEEFLNYLLQTISASSAGLWELAIIEDENKLRIIDKKFISKKLFENLYQFDISSDSCIKSFSFTVRPSNAQMSQVIAGSSNNQGQSTGQSTATQLPDFKFGDRINANQAESDTKKTFVNESSDLIKQLQKYGRVAGTYAMTLKYVSESDYYEVVNLALPSKNLLLSLMDCGDYEDNLNIYGGQQPNFTCELVLQGIAGLRTFQCFSVKNLPKPYSPEDAIFQIIDVTHSIQTGEWITTVKAGVRPISKLKNIVNTNYSYTNGKEAFESTNDVPITNIK